MRKAAKTILGAVLAALVGISSIPLSHAQSSGGAGGAGGAAGAGAGTTGAAPGSSGTATGTVGSGTSPGTIGNGAGSIQGGANSTLNPSGNPALNPPPGTASPGMGTSPRR